MATFDRPASKLSIAPFSNTTAAPSAPLLLFIVTPFIVTPAVAPFCMTLVTVSSQDSALIITTCAVPPATPSSALAARVDAAGSPLPLSLLLLLLLVLLLFLQSTDSDWTGDGGGSFPALLIVVSVAAAAATDTELICKANYYRFSPKDL